MRERNIRQSTKHLCRLVRDSLPVARKDAAKRKKKRLRDQRASLRRSAKSSRRCRTSSGGNRHFVTSLPVGDAIASSAAEFGLICGRGEHGKQAVICCCMFPAGICDVISDVVSGVWLDHDARAADPDLCRQFAKAAISQVRGALADPRCGAGVQGARWSTDFGVHYEWCLGASSDAAAAESHARTRFLAGLRQPVDSKSVCAAAVTAAAAMKDYATVLRHDRVRVATLTFPYRDFARN